MEHLTSADLQAVRSGRVSAAHAARIGAHLRSCAACTAASDEVLDLTGTVAAFEAALAGGGSETAGGTHLDMDGIVAWANGSMSPAERRSAAEHFRECPECESDAAELAQSLRPERGSRRAIAGMAIAASVAAIAIAGMLLSRGEPSAGPALPRRAAGPAAVHAVPPAPAPKPPAPKTSAREARWQELVGRVRATAVLPFPEDLRELAGADEFRGEQGEEPDHDLWPVATTVLERRPVLRWRAENGARYVVTLTSNGTVVARSDTLASPPWQPPMPLRRGGSYRWQVEVERNGESSILPAPPAPPAIFRVATAAEHAELAEASSLHPDDPLLLGILHARAGVVHESRRYLRQWARESRDPLAGRLLAQLPAAAP